jgi:hypothetical protein
VRIKEFHKRIDRIEQGKDNRLKRKGERKQSVVGHNPFRGFTRLCGEMIFLESLRFPGEYESNQEKLN